MLLCTKNCKCSKKEKKILYLNNEYDVINICITAIKGYNWAKLYGADAWLLILYRKLTPFCDWSVTAINPGNEIRERVSITTMVC